jgi:hypothetical protein
MTIVKHVIAILLLLMATACSDTRQDQSVKSLPDNQENRTIAAKRYLEIMPPKDLLHGVASRVGQSLPEKDRKPFMDIMESPAMEKEAYHFLLDGLVKHFTLGELNAMVTFYGSPEGQSSIKKFGPLMAEVMPKIQQEVKKGLAAVQKPPESTAPKAPKGQPEPPGPGEKPKK